MMGYNDGGEIYLPTTNNNSFSGSRKLRPLIPRPPPPHHHHLPNPTTNPHIHRHQGRHSHGHGDGHNQPCLARGVHNSDHFLELNHHLAMMAEQSKRELNVMQQVVVSSRWNPTPEQLRTLEDLWRRGTRTPSADEIQQITSRLRRYGKIEGKNVFYWFQNHKARERQKRRRQMEFGGCPDQEEHDHCETENLSHKDADTGGSSKTASEDVRRSNNDTPINNNNNWVNPHFLNSSEPAIEKEGKLAGGGGTASASSSAVVSVSSSSVVTSLRMNKSNDNDSISARALLLHSPNSNIFSISGSCCRDEDNNNDDDVNVPVGWHYQTATPPGSFFTYPSSSCRPFLVPSCPTTAGRVIVTVPPEMTASGSSSPASSSPLPNHEFQTLQLFPLRSCCDGEVDYAEGFGGRRNDDGGTGAEFAASNGHVDHHQFFEFLPLKN